MDRMRRVEPLNGPPDARHYVVRARPLRQQLEEVAAGKWASMVIEPADAREILAAMGPATTDTESNITCTSAPLNGPIVSSDI